MPRCSRCGIEISEEDAAIYGICDKCDLSDWENGVGEHNDEYIESLEDFDDYLLPGHRKCVARGNGSEGENKMPRCSRCGLLLSGPELLATCDECGETVCLLCFATMATCRWCVEDTYENTYEE